MSTTRAPDKDAFGLAQATTRPFTLEEMKARVRADMRHIMRTPLDPTTTPYRYHFDPAADVALDMFKRRKGR
jgi:hypothetical protein